MRHTERLHGIIRGLTRILCFLLCSVVLLSTTGCQSPKSASDAVHITLWHGVNPPANRDVLQRLVDRFNQTHPHIQVESLYVGQEDQQLPKILTAVVGNVPPNLLWYTPTVTGQLVELDAIRPLDRWLEQSAIQDDIDPVLLDSMRWEGQSWSIPFGVNNVGIFYRPSLFAEAGITALPTTWEELRQVAQTLTRQVDSRQQFGMLLPLGKGEWTVFMWLPFLWSAGGDLTTAAGALNLGNPGAIAAMQFWQDLVEDGSAILSQPERGYELDSFLAGKVAMQLTGPWTLRQLQATGVDFGVMPIPMQKQHATSIGGENLFVLKTTPDQEQAALVFAEYVLSEAFQTEWAIETGYLPVNMRSRQSIEYQNFLERQPALKVFLEQAPFGKLRPIFPGYSRISESVGRAIESVLLGQETPQSALQKAEQRLERLRP